MLTNGQFSKGTRRLLMVVRSRLLVPFAALVLSACAASNLVPGESYTKANSSLALQSWEATAALALVSVPACEKHNLINTEIVSVQEPLKIEGAIAAQGEWIEKWTYDMCGTFVAVKVEYEVDETGVGYRVSLW